MLSLDYFTPLLSATVPAHARLKIAVIHDDACAAARAQTTLGELEKIAPNRISLGSTLWRFELLECVAWRCRAAVEINAADVLIVALSRPDAVPGDIHRWMQICLDRLQQRKGTIVGIFGQEFSWAIGPNDEVTAPASAISALLDSQLAAA